MREQGKAGKVIKAVFGVRAGRKHQDGLVMDSLRQPSWEVIGHPDLIHQDITEVFQTHYAMPLDFDNDLHNAQDWQPYADDKALFVDV